MLKKIFIISATVLIVIAGVMTYKINNSIKDMGMNTDNIIIHEDDDEDIRTRNNLREQKIEETPEKPENFYALIIGIDSRDRIFTLNTDSLIVAHIIPQNKSIKMVSLPRDTRVETLRNEAVKINSIFAQGYNYARAEGRRDPSLLSGKEVTIANITIPEEYITSGSVVLRETVEKFLDIDIEYTFLVNFDTVTSLVDAVGGIEVEVDRSMQYDDPSDGTHIHLERGLQVLDGKNALNFSRFREDNRGEKYFSNDFERGIRQQVVITSLVNELSSWSNITQIFNILDIISTNFKTDMGRDTMFSLVRQFHGSINSESIHSISFDGYWRSPFVWITEENHKKLIEEFTSIDVSKEENEDEIENL